MNTTSVLREPPTRTAWGIVQIMNQTGQPMMERLRSLYAIFAPTLSLVCIAVLIIFTNMGGWITLATVFLASVVLLRANEKPRTIALKVLALSVGVSALDYVGWRFRVVNWDAWWVAVPLLAAEVFGILHTVGF